jgi:hypothetical protein
MNSIADRFVDILCIVLPPVVQALAIAGFCGVLVIYLALAAGA